MSVMKAMKARASKIKAFVIFRDRVTYARQCVGQLLEAGLDVYIVDHGSTYPPAVEWLSRMQSNQSNVTVLTRNENAHPRDLWTWEEWSIVLEKQINRLHELVGDKDRYIVTDCDVVLHEDCPMDWVDHLDQLLDKHPTTVKAGLGLSLEGIPNTYPYRERVFEWESQWWSRRICDNPAVYTASVDTTLAMYRSFEECPSFRLDPSIRTGWPYIARHLPWHERIDAWAINRSKVAELRWYEEHMDPNISHWRDPDAYERGGVE